MKQDILNGQRYIRLTAMNLLARRSHCVAELRRKLQHKLADEPNASEKIEAVLEQLLADGLLNDADYCASYIRYRTDRGVGPRRIEQELYQKGVEPALVAQSLESEENQIQWQQQIRKVWQKKYAKVPNAQGEPPDVQKVYSERMRQQRFLAQRGFSPEQIRTFFDSLDMEQTEQDS